MTIIAIGLNHKTADVELREKVAFAPDLLNLALQQLVNKAEFSEAVIISTCNRTELYCNLDNANPQAVIDWLSDFHNLDRKILTRNIYIYEDGEAIDHLMSVACGLDSLVLGEPQILGQLKQAYNAAKAASAIGIVFERLFQKTFSVAKQVRTETEIGASAVSVAYAAVSLAKHIYGKLSRTKVLLVGAGETIELVARHLHQNGCTKITVANRTLSRAEELAEEFHAEVIALSQVPERLIESDIVISSTASTLPIIGKGVVEYALKKRRYKPMLLVDIAVPRDIESQVAELEDAYLYTVDDLQTIVNQNIESRQKAAEQAKTIIRERVDEFNSWINSLSSVDLIRLYRSECEAIKTEMLERAIAQLEAGKPADKVLNELANRLSNRMMHAPTSAIKHAAESGEVAQLVQIKRTLGLD